jgi:hypothetical protein
LNEGTAESKRAHNKRLQSICSAAAPQTAEPRRWQELCINSYYLKHRYPKLEFCIKLIQVGGAIMKKLAIYFMVSILVTACGTAKSPTLPPPLPSPFEYYGWVYVFYTESNYNLERMATYTNTAFATSPEQAKILSLLGFKHIIYMLNETTVLERITRNEKLTVPNESQTAFFYQDFLPDFREKFFTAYYDYLTQLKDELITASVYSAIDVFYIADEPALHKNVYIDQAFLDQYADVFKQVFPDKKSAIAFSEITDPAVITSRPESGPHLTPPASLDIIVVDPYFYDLTGEKDLPCERNVIQNWLYSGNPFSNINWAKQFGKPIIVAGDAEIKAGHSPKDCYITETYHILKDDSSIAGLIWFIYDKEYNEGGYFTGAANDPALVELIENLGR